MLKKVLEDESCAVFTRCYCHSLDLAANNYVNNFKVEAARDAESKVRIQGVRAQMNTF